MQTLDEGRGLESMVPRWGALRCGESVPSRSSSTRACAGIASAVAPIDTKAVRSFPSPHSHLYGGSGPVTSDQRPCRAAARASSGGAGRVGQRGAHAVRARVGQRGVPGALPGPEIAVLGS
jgi:hypothetical protein